MEQKELENGAELDIQFGKRGGLVPCIVHDAASGGILMVAYVNEAALNETIKTGFATFWSTSRNELWVKGKTSGDLLKVKDILVDCVQDAIIYMVEKLGAGACHTKGSNGRPRASCFYRKIKSGKLEFLKE